MCSLTAVRGNISDLNPKWSSNQDRRKCGDVSISLTTTSLTLHCMFCVYYSDTLENFLSHIKNRHSDVLAVETILWPEAETIELQIKQEELELNETKVQDDSNSAHENAADPLLAEEENFIGCAVKCELIESPPSDESSSSDESDDTNASCNSDVEKPKFEHICRLIHYMHEHPILWNTELGAHFIRSERMSAIASISKLFLKEYPNLSIDSKYVQNKCNDLKNIYYNYNKTKPNKNYKKYYELLSFLKGHEKSKEARKICKVCNKDVSSLRKHMQKHHCGNETLQKCDTCEEMLPSSQKLQRHIQIVHRRYDCEHCTLTTYTNPKSWRKHMESKHPEIELPPKRSCREYIRERICEHCGKQFMSQNKLYMHINRVHLQLRPYACRDCPKAYSDLEKLKAHRNSVHLNNREHVCDVCSKAFFARKTMVQHRRLHSDVTNYVCRVCGKAFRQAPALHSHMKTHQ